MFIADHISAILIATGAVTMLPVFQFLFPVPVLKHFSKLEIHDEAGLFFARHWGLLAFSVGALLMYAAGHPELRAPAMLFAMIEKAGIVGLVALDRKRPYVRGLIGAALFDLSCVLLYGAYLGQLA